MTTGPAERSAGPASGALLEQPAQQAAAVALLLPTGEQAARRLLGGLDHHEAAAGEAHRERLTGGAPEQRAEAELVGPVVAGLQAGRPGDRRLRVDVGGLVDVEYHRSA